MKRFFTICLLVFLLLSACSASAESLSLEEMSAAQEAASWEETAAEMPDESAREEMIDRILSTAK